MDPTHPTAVSPRAAEPQGSKGASSWLRSAAAGAVAAMAMTGVRVVTTQLGIVKQVPPEAVFDKGAPRILQRLPKPYRKAAIELVHWSYGAAGGVVYHVLPASVRSRTLVGPLYGLALWVALEAVIEPMLGVRRRHGGRVAESATFVLDHALYGLVLASSSRAERAPVGATEHHTPLEHA